MSRLRTSLYLILWLTISAPSVALGQQPAPQGPPPLFLREEWRQRDRPPDAPANFVPEAGVTSAAVTNPSLELKLYDPNAKSVAGYEKQPPAGSIARDWSGPACIQLAGYTRIHRRRKSEPARGQIRQISGLVSARRRLQRPFATRTATSI